MTELFKKVNKIFKFIMSTFSYEWCYKKMKEHSYAIDGSCPGDGEGEFGCCVDCPYYKYSEKKESEEN